MYYCAQQGRAYATHAAVLEQLRDVLKAAKCGYRWVVERIVINPTALKELREWRPDLAGSGSHGRPMLIGATTNNLFAPLYLASWSEKALSRTEALLKDAEMQKKRVPNITASTWYTTLFSTYWRQRIAAAATATNAVFIGRIHNADVAAAYSAGFFKASRSSRFPKYHFFDPRRARESMAPPLTAKCSH